MSDKLHDTDAGCFYYGGCGCLFSCIGFAILAWAWQGFPGLAS